jgi:chitinase
LLLVNCFVSDANDFYHRTMVWAIDLDDGSLLSALTSVSTKKKEEILPELDFDTPDFGTSWDFIPEAKDKKNKHKRDEL